MSRHNFFFMGAFAGAALHGVMMSLYSDALGLEGFIERVRSTWIDARITVPIAVILLAVIIVGSILAIRLAWLGDDHEVERAQTMNMTVNVKTEGSVDPDELRDAVRAALARAVGAPAPFRVVAGAGGTGRVAAREEPPT